MRELCGLQTIELEGEDAGSVGGRMMLRVSDAGLGTVQSGVCSAEQCCFSPIFLCCVPMIPLWNKVTLCYSILRIYNFFTNLFLSILGMDAMLTHKSMYGMHAVPVEARI